MRAAERPASRRATGPRLSPPLGAVHRRLRRLADQSEESSDSASSGAGWSGWGLVPGHLDHIRVSAYCRPVGQANYHHVVLLRLLPRRSPRQAVAPGIVELHVRGDMFAGLLRVSRHGGCTRRGPAGTACRPARDQRPTDPTSAPRFVMTECSPCQSLTGGDAANHHDADHVHRDHRSAPSSSGGTGMR